MWEELYERYYRELSGYAQRMSGSPELGEDLVQDTFLRALQNPGILEDLPPCQAAGMALPNPEKSVSGPVAAGSSGGGLFRNPPGGTPVG